MLSITGSTRTQNSKSALPKASGSQSQEKAEASSSAGPASGIKPREKPLAGYLMARAAMHQQIDNNPGIEWKKNESKLTPAGKPEVKPAGTRPDTLDHLRAGHETVQEVSDLLPLGRANVREDIEKAKPARPDLLNASTTQLQRAFISERRYYRMAMTENDFYRLDAVLGQVAKTGTCDKYTANATALHGAKLAGMKDEKAIVAQAQDLKVKHTWSEMLPQGKNEKGKPILHREDVILDGWCRENLAVLREDSNFARLDKNGEAPNLSHKHLLDHTSGPGDLDKVKQFKSHIEGSWALKDAFHMEVKRREDMGWKPQAEFLWDAQSAFHADFRQQAGAALHKDAQHVKDALDAMETLPGKEVRFRGADPLSEQAKHASMAEIQAVGVALSLGSKIPAAAAEAPGTIAAAREMFPRPESEVN